jgi:glycosyltransferase involved in cell wall biosynthesis
LALVSIIIPAFNVEKYIFKCLSSISTQDFSDIEIFIVDDFSTDATGKIAREFAATDSRFHYIALDCNKGVMEARATGVRRSCGEFIGFVDADDWIEPRMISSLVNRLKADYSDIAICGVAYVDDSGDCVKKQFRFKNSRLISDGLAQFSMRKLGGAYLCNKLYRREVVFSDASFDFGVRLDVGEDILINVGAFARARSVSLMSEVLYSYRQTPSSVTGSIDNAEAFVNLFFSYCLCSAHYANLGDDILDLVDSFFRVQFNFRCYQITDVDRLRPHRERVSVALRLLSEARPEAVLYLMSVLKSKKRPASSLGEFVLRKIFW